MDLNNEWIFQAIYGEIILQFHKYVIISKNQFMNWTHYNGKIMCWHGVKHNMKPLQIGFGSFQPIEQK